MHFLFTSTSFILPKRNFKDILSCSIFSCTQMGLILVLDLLVVSQHGTVGHWSRMHSRIVCWVCVAFEISWMIYFYSDIKTSWREITSEQQGINVLVFVFLWPLRPTSWFSKSLCGWLPEYISDERSDPVTLVCNKTNREAGLVSFVFISEAVSQRTWGHHNVWTDSNETMKYHFSRPFI